MFDELPPQMAPHLTPAYEIHQRLGQTERLPGRFYTRDVDFRTVAENHFIPAETPIPHTAPLTMSMGDAFIRYVDAAQPITPTPAPRDHKDIMRMFHRFEMAGVRHGRIEPGMTDTYRHTPQSRDIGEYTDWTGEHETDLQGLSIVTLNDEREFHRQLWHERRGTTYRARD